MFALLFALYLHHATPALLTPAPPAAVVQTGCPHLGICHPPIPQLAPCQPPTHQAACYLPPCPRGRVR